MKNLSEIEKCRNDSFVIIYHLKSIVLFIFVCHLLFAIYYLPSAFATSPGTTGANFLKMAVGARPVGMGEAFVAVADDANAIYWNPASLLGFRYKEITFMHNEGGEEIRYEFLSYGQPVEKLKGGLGMSVCFLNVGNIEGYTPEGIKTRELDFYDLAFSLAYGCKITSNLGGGINLKVLQEKLDDQKAETYALDIGGLYQSPLEGLIFGVNIQNLGPKIKFIAEKEALPLNIKLGGAWKYKLLGNDLTMALDLNIPQDNDILVNMGGEFWVHNSIALRIGYKSRDDLANGLRLGLGLGVKGLSFDYAFSSRGNFEDSHRISITFRFGRSYEHNLIEKNIEEAFEQGKKYFLNGDLLSAHREFKNILTIVPGHEKAQDFLARTRVKVDEVVTINSINEHFNQGEMYYQTGELIRAKAEFENILEFDPEHQEAKEFLAKIEKRFEEVLVSFLNQGIEYYEKGDYLNAVSELKKVLILNPHHLQAKKYITMVREKQRKIEKIKRHQKTKRHYEKGVYLYEKKRFKEAIREFKKVLNTNPKYKKVKFYIVKSKNRVADRYFKNGLNLYQKEELTKALVEFEKVLTSNPKHKKVIDYITRINKKNVSSYLKQAMKLYSEEKLSEAISKFKEVLKLDSGNKQALGYLDKIRAQLNERNIIKAEEYNKQGVVEYSKGNLKKAIQAWEEALKFNPELETAEKNLKRAQAELNKPR